MARAQQKKSSKPDDLYSCVEALCEVTETCFSTMIAMIVVQPEQGDELVDLIKTGELQATKLREIVANLPRDRKDN